MNETRTVPYDFRVFEMDGVVWLYDESSRTYPCTSTPHVYAEPLYACDGSDIWPLDPGLFAVARGADPAFPGEAVMVIPAEEEEREAWDDARGEAQANHLI